MVDRAMAGFDEQDCAYVQSGYSNGLGFWLSTKRRRFGLLARRKVGNMWLWNGCFAVPKVILVGHHWYKRWIWFWRTGRSDKHWPA